MCVMMAVGNAVISKIKVTAIELSESHHIKELSVTEGQVLAWTLYGGICIYAIIVYYTAT